MSETTPVHAKSGSRLGLILLAAGGSTRMGRPKQLLSLGGEPMVVRAAREAAASGSRPIVVVLGHAVESLSPLLAPWPVIVVHNERWREGIGSSIRLGVETLLQADTALEGALVALCDQPAFTADTVQTLANAFTGPDKLVGSRYAGTVGAPAIFGRDFFPELLALSPEVGAQRLLKLHADDVTAVDLPELAVDLDTPEDYATFVNAAPGIIKPR